MIIVTSRSKLGFKNTQLLLIFLQRVGEVRLELSYFGLHQEKMRLQVRRSIDLSGLSTLGLVLKATGGELQL